MDVYLNEKSFVERFDINEVIVHLNESLKHLYNLKIKVHTNLALVNEWKNMWKDDFDLGLRTYINLLSKYLLNSEIVSGPFSFYFFNFSNPIELEIINNSCLINATNRILGSQNLAILNIPISKFCGRHYIPILKVPHNLNNPDNLANLPCFNTPIQLLKYIFLEEEVKPIIDKNSFDEFVINYNSLMNTFDYDNWRPKQFASNNRLDPKYAFPASSNVFLKKTISSITINAGDTGENITQWRQFGSVLLKVHGYSKNDKMSSYYHKKTGKIRSIFEGGKGNDKLFISLDLENGLFEVIEHDGTHIGKYNYDGSYKGHYTNQNDIQNHSLIEIPVHLFLF